MGELIGYVRCSTGLQDPAAQHELLTSLGVAGDRIARSVSDAREIGDALSISSSVVQPSTSSSIASRRWRRRAASAVSVSAALAAQVNAAGSEHVLTAVLANASYGASVGAGMLAEGHKRRRTGRLRDEPGAQGIRGEGPGLIGA